MLIQDLLNRIRWDKEWNEADFSIEYYDRVSGRDVSLPFSAVSILGDFLITPKGQIPIHRIRRVLCKGIPIFDRNWVRDVKSRLKEFYGIAFSKDVKFEVVKADKLVSRMDLPRSSVDLAKKRAMARVIGPVLVDSDYNVIRGTDVYLAYRDLGIKCIPVYILRSG